MLLGFGSGFEALGGSSHVVCADVFNPVPVFVLLLTLPFAFVCLFQVAGERALWRCLNDGFRRCCLCSHQF